MRNVKTKRQTGASIVHWLVALVPLMAFGALAVDLNNLYVSLAQLQTAADAGALEGARLLYIRDPVTNDLVINTSSDNAAQTAAEANLSQGTMPEVTVLRGHWQFTTNTPNPADPPNDPFERGGLFTANASTALVPLTNPDGTFKTWQVLNNDTNHINAVEVVAARNLTPVQAFFGPLLGINGYQAQATAVAYVGFAGSVAPLEFDMPIAMCDDVFDITGQGCNVGRLVPEGSQTAGWTNLDVTTDGSCNGAANANELRTLVGNSKVCPGGGGINAQEITLGGQIPVNNGQVNSAFDDMYDCWKSHPDLDQVPLPPNGDGWPDQPMEWFLPVIYGCTFGGSCSQVIGGVTVEVLWMFLNTPGTSGSNSIHNTAPTSMGDWSNNDPDGVVRWNDFVDHFNLQMDGNGTEATYANGGAIQKTIYFKPSCDPVELGGTGGANYGVLAEVPVLVR